MENLTEAERKRRMEVLKMLLAELEKPVANPPPKNEQEREAAAKAEARAAGRELLTPKAASVLFGKAPVTVRRAVAGDYVLGMVRLNFTERPVFLIQLESAIQYWGKPTDSWLLEQMRDNGHTLGINGVGFNVLSLERLVSLNNSISDLEDEE